VNEQQKEFKQWLDWLPDQSWWRDMDPVDKSRMMANAYVNSYIPNSVDDRATWEYRGTVGKPLNGPGTITEAQYNQVSEFLENLGPRFPDTFGIKAGEYTTKKLDFLMDGGRANREERVVETTRFLQDPASEMQIKEVKDLDFGSLTWTELGDPNVITAIREFAPERTADFIMAQRQAVLDKGIWSRGGAPKVEELELDENGFADLKVRAAAIGDPASIGLGPTGPFDVAISDEFRSVAGPKATMFKNAAIGHLRDWLAEGIQSFFDDSTHEERQAKLVGIMDKLGQTYLTDDETEMVRSAYVTWPAELAGYLAPGVGAAKAPGLALSALKAIPRLKNAGSINRVIRTADRFNEFTDTAKTVSRVKTFGKQVIGTIPSVISDSALGWISAEDYPAIGREIPTINAWLRAHGIDPETPLYSAAEAGAVSGVVQSLFAAVKPFIGAINDTSARGAFRKNKVLGEAAAAVKEASKKGGREITDAEAAKLAREIPRHNTSAEVGEAIERFKESAKAAHAAEEAVPKVNVDVPVVRRGKGTTTEARELVTDAERAILDKRDAAQATRAASSRAGGAGVSTKSPPQPVPPVPEPPKPKVDVEIPEGINSAERYAGLGRGHEHLDKQLAAMELRKEMTPLSRVFLRELMRDVDDDFLRAFTIDNTTRDEMGIMFSGFARHGNANDLTRGTVTDRQALFDGKGAPTKNIGQASNPRIPGSNIPIIRGPSVVLDPASRKSIAPTAKAGFEIAQLNAKDLSYVTWHEVGHIAQNFLLRGDERAAFKQFAQEIFVDDKAWKRVAGFISKAHKAGGKGTLNPSRIPKIRGNERELFAELFALHTTGKAIDYPSLKNLFVASSKRLRNSVRSILGRADADILDAPLQIGDSVTTVGRMFEDVLTPRKPGYFEDLENLYGPKLGRQKAKLLRTELRKYPINEDTAAYLNNRWRARGKDNLRITVLGDDPKSSSLEIRDADTDMELAINQDGTSEFSDLITQETIGLDEVNRRIGALDLGQDVGKDLETAAAKAGVIPKKPVPTFRPPEGAPPKKPVPASQKTGTLTPPESTRKPPAPKPEPTPTPSPLKAALAFSPPPGAKPKRPVPKAQQAPPQTTEPGLGAFRAPPKKLKGNRPTTPVDSSPSTQRVEVVGDGITLQIGETVMLKNGDEAVVAYIPSRQPLPAKGRQADIGPIYIHGKFGPERISSDKIESVLGYSTKPKPKTFGDPNMEYATEGVTLKQWTVGNRSEIRLDPWQVTLLNQIEAGYQARLVTASKAFEGKKNVLRRGVKAVRDFPQEAFNVMKLFEMNELHERMLADVIGQPAVMRSPEHFSRRVLDALSTTSGTITTNARAKLFVNMLNDTLEKFPPVQAKRIYRKLFDDISEARPAGMEMPGNSELYLKRAILAIKGEKGDLARATLAESQTIGDYFADAVDDFGYVGVQEGLPERGIPDIELWDVLTREYETMGLVEGSTVSRETIERLGLELPSNQLPDAGPRSLDHGGMDPMAEDLADDIGDEFVDNASSYLAALLVRDGYRGTVARALTPVAHLGMDEEVNRALIEVLSKDLDIPVSAIRNQQQILERAQSTLNRWMGEGKIPIGEIPSSFSRPADINSALNTSHEPVGLSPVRVAKREDARRAIAGNPRDQVNLEPIGRGVVKTGDLIYIGNEPWVVIENTPNRIAISNDKLGKVFVTPDDLEGGFIFKDRDIPVKPMRIDLPDMDIDISRLTDPNVAIQGLNPAEKMITLAAKYAMIYGTKGGQLFKKAMDATGQSKPGKEVWSFISGLANTPRASLKHESIKGYVTARSADWFLSAGFLPRDIHLRNVARASQLKYEEWWARRLVQRYAKVTDEFLRETKADDLSEELISKFNDYLKAPSLTTLRGLPKNFRPVLSNMRRHQTRISRALITSGAIDPNSPIAMIVGKNDATYLHRSYAMFEDESYRQRMLTKLKATNGNDAVFRNVRGWATEKYVAAGLNPDDYAEEIAAYPGQILHMREGEYIGGNAGFGKTMANAAQTGQNKIRLPAEIFFHKGDVAEPIRRLMGEYGADRGVEIAYLNSVIKSSKWMNNHLFLTQIREMGLAKGMFRTIDPNSIKNKKGQAAGVGHTGEAFRDPITGKAWDHQVIKPGEFGYKQLENLVTTEQIAKQLRRMLGVAQRGGEHKVWEKVVDTGIIANSWAKLNATVFNMMTHVRNFLGNTEFMVNNGYLADFIAHPGVTAGRGADAAQLVARNVAGEGSWASSKAMQLGRMSDEQWERKMEHLIRVGIIGEGTFTGEVRALYKDFSQGGVYESHGSLYEKFLSVFERAGEKSRKLARTNKAHSLVHRVGSKGAKVFEAYQAGDDFWRIMAYELESNKLANALLGTANGKGGTWTADAVRREAAQRVRDTMPTYSEVPRFIQGLRLSPVNAPFVSFWWESFRTRINGFKYAFRDMASDNAAMQKLGAQRMMGLMAVPTSYLVLEKASQSIDEVLSDPSKNESVRYAAPPWNRHGNIVGANNKLMDKIFGKRPSNVVRYADMSYLFPIEYLMDPLRTVIRGDPGGENRLLAAAYSFFEPILGTELFVQKIIEVGQNKGNRFRGEGRPALDSVKATVTHLLTPMVPGTVKSAGRIAQGVVDSNKEDSLYGLRRNPLVELVAVGTGVRMVELNLDTSHGNEWIDARMAVKDGRRQFNRNAIYTRTTIDDDEVIRWYEKMVQAEHKGWARAHVAAQNFANLDQPRTVAMREMRRAGWPANEVRSLLTQSPKFKATTIANRDFKAMRDNGQRGLNETAIRQRALAIANEYESLPVDLVAEQIRARHLSD